MAETQAQVLRRILRANAATEFGEAHEFASIRSVAEFQERVPNTNYETHKGWIDRVAAGTPNVLTHERVRLFEPTGGSSGATKLIPYTRSLQGEFQRGIRAWIADLFLNCPKLLGGPAYWSVSPPALNLCKTTGGIPVGFDHDSAYVGGWQRHLVNAAMAVPSLLHGASDVETFHYRSLLYLVRARDLRLISVWSPSYLTLLLARLPEWADRICSDLTSGALGPAAPQRSREVCGALRANSEPELYSNLWPELQLISCWCDSNASGPAALIARLFPRCRIQGKGLIATEAFISFPLWKHEHSALSVRSHFLEFIPEGSGRPRLAHELDRGGRYSVSVTTGGGLYRYQLGDLVEVTGHVRGCPLIRFLGRHEGISDWFGEKLNDAFVSRVLQDVFGEFGLAPSFAMLACDTNPPAGYVLYIESPEDTEVVEQTTKRIEIRLCENFQYNYARQLGQLSNLRFVRVQNGAAHYISAAVRNGQKAGGVKIPALDARNDWSRVFTTVSRDKHRDQITWSRNSPKFH